MKITGIILAGGKSSRMGQDKGLLSFNGIPMIQSIIQQFEKLNIPFFIVSNNEAYEQFNVPVYKDIIPDKGPVGGIYTALKHTKTEKNFIISCDTPLVSEELLTFLMNSHKNNLISFAKHKDQVHPLIGIYNKSTQLLFKNAIDEDRLKLRRIFDEVKVNQVEIPETILENSPRCLYNINTTEDLEKINDKN